MDSTLNRVGGRLLGVFSGAEGEGSAVDVPGAEGEGSAVDGRAVASASGDGSFGADQVVCSPASVSPASDPVPSVPYVSHPVPSISHASHPAPPFDDSPVPRGIIRQTRAYRACRWKKAVRWSDQLTVTKTFVKDSALLLEFRVPDPVALGILQRPDIVFMDNDDGDDDDDEEEEEEEEKEKEAVG